MLSAMALIICMYVYECVCGKAIMLDNGRILECIDLGEEKEEEEEEE